MPAVSAPSANAVKVAKKAAKGLAAHPPFARMIFEAIVSLKERGGSSRQAILKYIKSHHKVVGKVADVQVRRVLVSAVKAGKLVRVKGMGASGSFKVSEKMLEKNKSNTPSKKPLKSMKVPAARKKAVTPKKLTTVKAEKPAAAKPKKAASPAKTKLAVVPAKAAHAKPKKSVAASKPKKPAVKKTPKKAASLKK